MAAFLGPLIRAGVRMAGRPIVRSLVRMASSPSGRRMGRATQGLVYTALPTYDPGTVHPERLLVDTNSGITAPYSRANWSGNWEVPTTAITGDTISEPLSTQARYANSHINWQAANAGLDILPAVNNALARITPAAVVRPDGQVILRDNFALRQIEKIGRRQFAKATGYDQGSRRGSLRDVESAWRYLLAMGADDDLGARANEYVRRRVLEDVVQAAHIITRHDPTPGTLATHFIGEETGNCILQDAALHERVRKWLVGEIGRGELPAYARESALPVNLPPETYANITTERLIGPVPAFPQWADEPVSFLKKETLYGAFSSPRVVRDADECCPFMDSIPRVRDGAFYESPTFRARVGSLDPGVYGETRVDRLPFEVVISNRCVPDRALVSFVHEALHGYDELHKLGIDHNQLHSLAVFLTQEAIPGYLALKSRLS